MAVNVKLGVDLSAFTSGIREGQSIMKGLNAEMKATEAEFKATGNAEQMLANKTKTLNSQIQVQKGIANQAAQALKAMKEAGIDPADAAYQKLYATMMNATAGMNNAQAELNALSGSAQGAASSADNLTTSVQNIGKKISLDQVITGIDKITSGLEAAAQKAVQLGKDLWNSIMDSARLSDDIATQARIFDMTPELYQQYKGVFDTIAEVTMQDWATARRKVEKAMESPSNDQIDVLTALGFGGMVGGKGSVTEETVRLTADNWEDAFWNVASEIKRRVDSGEISLATADVWGEAMFGKKYANLKNLIDMGPEAFAAALQKQNVASQEAIEKNAALNDAVIKLQNSYDALKMEVTSGLAPALTDAATALDGLLGKLLEYLKSENGQKMLESLSESVTTLFEDLGKIDPESVVESFTKVFTGLVDSMQWIVNNKETLVGALEAIVAGWAGLKITGSLLTIIQFISGLRDLRGGGTGQQTETGATGTVGTAGVAQNVLLDTKVGQAAATSMVLSATTALLENGNIFNDSSLSDNEQISKWVESQVEDGFISAGDSEKLKEQNIKMMDALKEHAKDTEIPVNVVAADGSAEALASQIGTVTVPVALVYDGSRHGAGGLGGAVLEQRANGWPYVPYDGMLASLHKGEQVVPAREVQSRSYNSNLYVESMIMNNGSDAAGLASAMAAAQRRAMSGFGS